MLLQRSVLAEAARNFLGSLCATTGMAFFVLSVTFLKRTPGVGMDFLLEVFPLFFPLALQFTVPLAVLIATVFTFSRMASDGELTALGASGVSLLRVVRPVLAAAAIVSLGALLMQDGIAPFAGGRIREAARDLIHQMQTSFRAGKRDLDLGKAHLSFEGFDQGVLTDLCVEVAGQEGEMLLWRAERGGIAVTTDDQVVVRLDRAGIVKAYTTKHGELHIALDSLAHEIPVGELLGGARAARKRSDLRAWELAYAYARGKEDRERRPISGPRAVEELVRRNALAGSAFFFALLGVPMGILSARGGRVTTFLIAVAPILLIFFPLVMAGTNLARTGKVAAYPALWSGNAVLCILGVLLLRKVLRR
ncbi:MAG: LptF/LptG family permease [Planctomycetaceae bacterium]